VTWCSLVEDLTLRMWLLIGNDWIVLRNTGGLMLAFSLKKSARACTVSRRFFSRCMAWKNGWCILSVIFRISAV